MRRIVKIVWRSCFGAVLSLLLLTGCSQKTVQVSVPVELPSSFSGSGSTGIGNKWWLAFEDPDLDRLIDQALRDNFSLKGSWEKLNQAKAVYRKSRSSLFPTLDGEASGSYTGKKLDSTDGSTVNADEILLGLSAQYEVDLWGRIESTIDADRLDMEATAADLDTAAMTLAATIAERWYLLVQQNASITLLDRQIDTNKKALEVIVAQFRTGQVPMADVLQQRQLIESKMAEKIKLVADRGQSEHQLAILTGNAPGLVSFPVPDALVSLPELPATGIPAELILARPDIRSAFYAVEAADKLVAAAIADRFPTLRFTLSLDTYGNSTGDIFSNYLASAAGSLAGPIIDGGKRKAEVERTEAVAAERLHNYGQAILTAVGEVEDALIEERQQALYIKSLQTQLDLAVKTMEQVKQRYLKGVENYQRVLTALTSLQSLQQSQLSARKDILVNRVELYRALGTGWGYSDYEIE